MWADTRLSEMTMGQCVIGYGLNESTNLNGSIEALVSTYNPLTPAPLTSN